MKSVKFYTHPGQKSQKHQLMILKESFKRWRLKGHDAGAKSYRTGNPKRPYGVVVWHGDTPYNLNVLIKKEIAKQKVRYSGASLQKLKRSSRRRRHSSRRKSQKRH
jgi:hypothetical protein